MSPLFQQIIIDQAKKNLRKERSGEPGKQALEKEARRIKLSFTQPMKEVFLITAGVASAGFGLKGFLLPNGFIDGGVTGISLLVAEITNLPLALLILLINAPFVLMGYKQVGKGFGLKSIVAIVGLSAVVAFVEYPVITSDKLLIAVFGGFFLGAGIGLSVRGGSVLDGTEVLAVWLSKRTALTIGDVILIFNIMIFAVAAILLSVETALYAILTYLAASKTVDFIVEGIEEYMGVTIISNDFDEIRRMILEKLGRGVTIYAGKGGFAKEGKDLKNIDIVYTVITRLELARLKSEVEKIDPQAFIVMHSIRDIKGGVIKKRPLAH